MTRSADRILTDPGQIERLQARIAELPNGAHVELELDDGSQASGIVAARPVAQLFYGPDGDQGTNAVVRLEDPAMDAPERAGWRDLWVDRITRVRRLDPARHVDSPLHSD